jgi:ABC-type Fe3+/spermidine/putrescine transport system ATPase subunit
VVEQLGDPRTVYRRPANRFVADFIGETNWLEGEVVASTAESLSVLTAAGMFVGEWHTNLAAGVPVWTGFRPESVQLTDHGENQLPCRIRQVNYLGDIEEYVLESAGGLSFKAFAQNPAEALVAGHELQCSVRRRDVLILPRTN